jgi:hypothetical protein
MENFNDYLFPFSLGCLDKEEKKKLKEFIEGNGDFNFQELGEYQNLVSLLPCILNIETPEALLKDDVARKLYRLKDEIKTRRNKNKSDLKIKEQTKENTNNIQTEKPGFETSNEFDDIPLFDSANREEEDWKEESIKKPQGTVDRTRDMSHLYKTYNPEDNVKGEEKYSPEENPDFEQEKETEEDFHINKNPNNMRVQEDNIENIIRGTNPPTFKPETANHKKYYSIMLVVFLLFFVVVVGLMIGYWKISSDVKEYKNDVEKLNKQISSLTMRLSSSQEIDQMLQSPNVQIINLKGTNLNSSGYGKLIISPEKGSGYIQLAQMPALPEDKTFQLWISVSGNFMPLETFHATEKMEYYSFKMPNIPHGYDVSFLITEELAGGSKTPGKKVFLTGNM